MTKYILYTLVTFLLAEDEPLIYSSVTMPLTGGHYKVLFSEMLIIILNIVLKHVGII